MYSGAGLFSLTPLGVYIRAVNSLPLSPTKVTLEIRTLPKPVMTA